MRLIARYLPYIGLGILFLILGFWDQVTKFAPTFSDRDLLSVLVLVVGAFIIYFDTMLRRIIEREESLYHLSVGDALRRISTSKRGRIRNLRIYALTTEVIQPIVRDLDLKIDSCRIMLHQFTDNSHCKHAAKLNANVAEIAAKWLELERSGQIQKLEIVYYTDMPCIFSVIADTSLMLHGCYSPNDDSIHGNDFKEPYLLVADSKTEGLMIAKNITWFDSYFEYWEKRKKSEC